MIVVIYYIFWLYLMMLISLVVSRIPMFIQGSVKCTIVPTAFNIILFSILMCLHEKLRLDIIYTGYETTAGIVLLDAFFNSYGIVYTYMYV